MGNSAARRNRFGVARGLVAVLQRLSIRVRFDYTEVAGGFEPDHLFNCGLRGLLLEADLVVFLYHSPRGGAIYEKLIRSIQSLPRWPQLLYVSHCVMHDFSAMRDWREHRLFSWFPKNEPPGHYETLRPLERRLARHYGLTFVDTCEVQKNALLS